MSSFSCLTRDGIRLAGDCFGAGGYSRGTVVLAHGLPSAQSAPADAADEGYPGLARRIAREGFNVAIFNFRGTGMSGGHVEIDRWADDLGSVLDYLDGSEMRADTYAVVGFSAGGAAAILRCAEDERIEPLITMAAPADFGFLPIEQDARAWFAWYREMGMIRDGYEKTAEEWADGFRNVVPRETIGRAKAKTIYLLHGTADDTVPVTHAGILEKAAGEKARALLIAGGIHQMRRDERAMETLLDVLNQTHR